MDAAKPLRADALRNREALITKAREAFDAGNFDLRFDDFALLAGVGTGTLYRHFPTREALVEAVYHDEIALLCGRARELQETLAAEQALEEFLRGMIDHMRDHAGLARTLATLMGSGSTAPAEGTLAMEEAVSGLIAAGVREGSLRDDIGAGSVLMAVHGIGAAYDQPDWDAAAHGVITLVLDGLRRVPRSNASASASADGMRG